MLDELVCDADIGPFPWSHGSGWPAKPQWLYYYFFSILFYFMFGDFIKFGFLLYLGYFNKSCFNLDR